MREIDVNSPFWGGCVPTGAVAALSGLSRGRLGRWHRNGTLTASHPPYQPGAPRIYTWLEYCRARAAAKLLARGLPLRELSAMLARIDAEVPQWERALLLPIKDGRLTPGDRATGSKGITALQARTAGCSAGDEAKLIADVLTELVAEGPLGALSAHGRYVTMHPLWMSNEPILTGTRLPTRMFRSTGPGGAWPPQEAAEDYGISTEQVCGAFEFERDLAALMAVAKSAVR